jgi:monofunctional biosynthetic peptidoglycan transglycosylase
MQVLTMVAAMIGWISGDGSDDLLLTDFDSVHLSWTTVNDEVMGGRSQGGFEIEEGVLTFRGVTNTDGGGFSSIRTSPERPVLGGREAIRLRVRGDGRTYTFRLDTGEARAVYWAEFPTVQGEWTEVRLPLDSFVARWRGRVLDRPAVDPAEVVAVGIMIYDKRDGPFRLEVDWIRADMPFRLGALEWKRRPLVLFAPASDDPRLGEQLRAVRAAREGFLERDMTLVVAAPGHGLSAKERQALRERLEAPKDAFALRLVGKDGTVKRRSAGPVPMSTLFDQIDAMPMRQSEMGR